MAGVTIPIQIGFSFNKWWWPLLLLCLSPKEASHFVCSGEFPRCFFSFQRQWTYMSTCVFHFYSSNYFAECLVASAVCTTS
ncbi:hypothetical protein VIGAN_UM011800 [Vigna angularis var. angularis]|uniref:Secreted protein n=1 Tax=Vigna angularis var. angularis TaxID=157739 RepID=A0A0S3TDR6_PHAAN|nr:hypothetical protein VIGAN_UM011800 [Vigna angularis var. angularis]